MHALVTNVLPYQVTARIGQQQVILGPDDFAWTGQRDAENFLKPGDIIYVHIVASTDSNLVLHAVLEQDSGIQGSLMAVDNTSGEVSRHGRRARLQPVAVQPRHPGRAADGVFLQTLRLHRCRG